MIHLADAHGAYKPSAAAVNGLILAAAKAGRA
jgi:hypothetical protein